MNSPVQSLLHNSSSEAERLAALARYEILDTPSEQEFDAVVRLASQICNTPVSLISLVDQDRQWFKAEIGLDVAETPLDMSVCQYAIQQDGVLEISDAIADERTQHNPLVTGAPNFRFYSGAVLKTSDGFKLGTLCVLDYEPRTLTEPQKFALQTLADQVMTQLELRRAVKERERAKIVAEHWQRVYETVLTNTPDFIYVIGLDKRFIYANDALLQTYGRPRDQVIGKNFYELGYEPWHAALHESEIDTVIATRHSIRNTIPFTGTQGTRIYDYIFSPVLNADGEVTAIAGTTRDITEQEKTATALRLSEERRAVALEASDFIGIWDWDMQTDLVVSDARFAQLYSVDPALAQAGAPLAEFTRRFHPDDLAHVGMAIERVKIDGGIFSEEYRLLQADGSVRWVVAKGRAQLNEQGKPVRLPGVVIDITERKNAEQKLSKTEEDFRFAQEAGGIGTFALDLHSGVIEVTPEFCRMFGVSPTETLTADRIEKLFHPDDLPLRATQMLHSDETVDLNAEYRIYRGTDQALRWIARRARYVCNEQGDPVQLLGIVQDITEQKLADAMLREKEDQFRTMAQAMPNQVWTATPEGHFDWFNQQIFTYSGLAYDDLAGEGWAQLVHPDDVEASAASWASSIVSGNQYEVQFRIRRHDGVYRWHLVRALPIQTKDGRLRWIGTNTDIEDQKAATEAVDDARAHLSLMVESAEDYAIISMDIAGRVVIWNQGAERIFGYQADEIIGEPVDVIFTPEDRAHDAPAAELQLAAMDGRTSDERWHMRKNGERFYVSGTMASMRDQSGQVKGYIKIARDMTEQRRAQEALVEARNAAEAANIAKTEFLANMSHEIRTPMNAVIGLSNILAISQPLTQKQKDFIKTLQLSADSLLSLINDLLDIAKIEARTVDLEHVPFSLTQLMQEVISMMGVRVREKNLRFTGESECVAQKMFMGDPTRLRQIILNLCSNAIKFTETGGVHIEISCEGAAQADTEIVCISVQDTGIGIAPDKLDTIFHKFTQADSSINRKYGGTGLGLAITKTLTEIMGGVLSVDSTVGEGSNFQVRIPMKSATDIEVQTADLSFFPIAQHAVQTKISERILLVEDYAPNILVATTFLESFGYECDVAQSGVEAIERAKAGHYVAALMDVQMHGMNGLEATRMIRELERQHNKPRLPIIGMTAHALMGDKERCLSAGMDDYIAKPFNPAELKDKLEKLARVTLQAA